MNEQPNDINCRLPTPPTNMGIHDFFTSGQPALDVPYFSGNTDSNQLQPPPPPTKRLLQDFQTISSLPTTRAPSKNFPSPSLEPIFTTSNRSASTSSIRRSEQNPTFTTSTGSASIHRREQNSMDIVKGDPLSMMFQAHTTQILTLLEDIKMQAESNHRSVMKYLEDKFGPPCTNSSTLDDTELPQMPAGDEEELEAIEKYIDASPANNLNLIHVLSIIGGSSRENAIRRILCKVMSNHLAVKFSYQGKKGKKIFCILKVHAAIVGAIRSRQEYVDTTEHEIKLAISNWLQSAPARSKMGRNISY